MSKLKVSFLCILVSTGLFGQGKFELHAGAAIGKLSFPGFQNFVDSYNVAVAKKNTMLSPLKFNPYSKGWKLGGYYTISRFVAGINAGKLSGNKSTAEFNYDQRRVFQFKNYNFDVDAGVRIGGEKHGFTPFLTMSINTLNLHAYYEYGDLRSYGGESSYNGVWTSWRMVYLAGLRYTYSMERWGVYLDFAYPINKSEYLGGDFKESNSATDAYYFTGSADPDIQKGIDNQLKEEYRQLRGSFGITFLLNKP